MFEINLEQMTACVWIDQRDKDILDQYGCVGLQAGGNSLNYPQAVDLITQYHRSRMSVAKSYKYNLKRFDAIFHSIMNAFGPEFWALHGTAKAGA